MVSGQSPCMWILIHAAAHNFVEGTFRRISPTPYQKTYVRKPEAAFLLTLAGATHELFFSSTVLGSGTAVEALQNEAENFVVVGAHLGEHIHQRTGHQRGFLYPLQRLGDFSDDLSVRRRFNIQIAANSDESLMKPYNISVKRLNLAPLTYMGRR